MYFYTMGPTLIPPMEATCFLLAIFLAHSLALKSDVIYSTETTVNFYWTARRYIPENSSLHSSRCEDSKSNIFNGILFTVSPLYVKRVLLKLI
jgi:hypothetical protein